MKINAKELAELAGMGVVELSTRLGMSRGAVSQWEIVPPERVIAVCELTAWKKTPHELRPDLYPHPFDGLPCFMRGAECPETQTEQAAA